MRKFRQPFFLIFFISQFGYLFAQVRLGIDELESTNFAELQARHVALITNQTGLDRRGDSTVDILKNAPGVNLICILTPEHGFRGTSEHGQSVDDTKDPKTGLPVYSLYGTTQRPTDKMLKKVNTIVFDIQDVGTRFYTYITTMGMAMEEASKKNIRFVVLDRPNPIRGDIIEGDILDTDIKRMTGYFPIPVRHGLTVGELAQWIKRNQNLKLDLRIVSMKRWQRDLWYDETGLTFIPPSPNIRTVNQALLYSGIGCFEATNVAVGRGTDTPFEIFGAPWIKSKPLCAYLREKNFPGVLFEPVEFVPENDLYKGEKCQGIRMIITDRSQLRPIKIFLSSFLFLKETYPTFFKPDWEEIRVVTGSSKLRAVAEGQMTLEDLLKAYDENLSRFRNEMSTFFLY